MRGRRKDYAKRPYLVVACVGAGNTRMHTCIAGEIASTQISELDSIVEQSPRSFYLEICSLKWCGGGQEMGTVCALTLAQQWSKREPIRPTLDGY
jgi:hypothetical protein